ncbi:MAG: chaperone modulator CbpM [Dysgonomonas sp.]
MNTELIIIKEYCIQNQIDPEFIIQLENEGLIEINIIENEQYIHVSQLNLLDQYTRWHYDLAINIEGIDVIQNLLHKINDMQKEIFHLREQLRLMD